MATEYIETLLAHRFFEGMKKADVQAVSDCCTSDTFDEGTYLFRQGDPAQEFFLIQEGAVSLEIQLGEQAPIVIQTRGAGKVLGWSWIFPGEEWKFNARVIRPVKTVTIHTPCLNGKIENDSELGYELLRRVARVMMDRLQATRMQLMDIYAPGETTSLY
jgi:CRP/FNR family transcriptional regulator, cyclic AMP receptor protein